MGTSSASGMSHPQFGFESYSFTVTDSDAMAKCVRRDRSRLGIGQVPCFRLGKGAVNVSHALAQVMSLSRPLQWSVFSKENPGLEKWIVPSRSTAETPAPSVPGTRCAVRSKFKWREGEFDTQLAADGLFVVVDPLFDEDSFLLSWLVDEDTPRQCVGELYTPGFRSDLTILQISPRLACLSLLKMLGLRPPYLRSCKTPS